MKTNKAVDDSINDDDIASLFSAQVSVEPSDAVDRLILERANQALKTDVPEHQAPVPKPASRGIYALFAIAAVVVLSVTLVPLMHKVEPGGVSSLSAPATNLTTSKVPAADELAADDRQALPERKRAAKNNGLLLEIQEQALTAGAQVSPQNSAIAEFAVTDADSARRVTADQPAPSWQGLSDQELENFLRRQFQASVNTGSSAQQMNEPTDDAPLGEHDGRAQWLAKIRHLLESGDTAAVMREWLLFERMYPDAGRQR
jgi:hypothetical protein